MTELIGRMSYIDIADARRVPAKIDTGAYSSSVHVSSVEVDDQGVLHYILFDPSEPYYTGKRHATTNYDVAVVRSSNGHEQIRYVVRLRAVIKGKHIKANFTLADRSKNKFPILLGTTLLQGHFLVDVSDDAEYKEYAKTRPDRSVRQQRQHYLTLSRQDAHQFYKNYYLNQE